jgi:urease accessory protein
MNLRLLQLGDSALPIGGYSHSWGLETAIDQGLVRDASDLEEWVRSSLTQALGPLEGVIVANVCRAVQNANWQAVRNANDLLQASLTPPSLRSASAEMGMQLFALAEGWPWAEKVLSEWLVVSGQKSEVRERRAESRDRWSKGTHHLPLPTHHSPLTNTDQWHHAVVFATLAAAAGATPTEAVSVYLHQAALGMIGAGVRAIPIGHTHGQQILARLHEDLDDLATKLASREIETAGSFGPAYEILCHAQTRLYTRLFRS